MSHWHTYSDMLHVCTCICIYKPISSYVMVYMIFFEHAWPHMVTYDGTYHLIWSDIITYDRTCLYVYRYYLMWCYMISYNHVCAGMIRYGGTYIHKYDLILPYKIIPDRGTDCTCWQIGSYTMKRDHVWSYIHLWIGVQLCIYIRKHVSIWSYTIIYDHV